MVRSRRAGDVILLGSACRWLAAAVEQAGCEVLHAVDLAELRSSFTSEVIAVVATWHHLGVDVEQSTHEVRLAAPGADLVLMAQDGAALSDAITAIRLPAVDFVLCGADCEASVIDALRRCALVRQLQRLEAEPADAPEAIVGESRPIHKLKERLRQLRGSEMSILLTGETGTGKEIVARELHRTSPRAQGPFVAVNCAAVPAQLLESEFFGHRRGAFTDAHESAKGLFVMANGGTLFLDEIGAMPLELQPKLLRALQERRVRAVGASQETPADVRVIAASNVNLPSLVGRGEFRSDLYYRLNVIEFTLPSLRERPEDVLLLAYHFLRRTPVADTKPVHGFTPAAARLMLNYDWPGNVRELQNAVEAACSLTRFDHVTDLDLPARLRETRTPAPLLPLDDVERSHIGHVMQLADGNKAEAARMLGITRKTLYRKLKHHGLLHARQQIPSEPGLRDTPV